MFVINHPAMKIGKYLVIADLHIGITSDIYKSGIRLPKQAAKIAERINKLKKATKTSKLVIIGDIKHNIPSILAQEKKEIVEFLSLVDFNEIIMIKGNHDGRLEEIIDKKYKIQKSMQIGKYFLTHGHTKIKTNHRKIVMAHNHPGVMFRDKMNAHYIEPVWVIEKSKKHEIIIMPAFNELCGSTLVNRDKLIGPVAKRLKKTRMHLYLLDGTDIGFASDLVIKDAI